MDKPRIRWSALDEYNCTSPEGDGWGSSPGKAFDDWMTSVNQRRADKDRETIVAAVRRSAWEKLKDPEGYAKRASDAEAQWRATEPSRFAIAEQEVASAIRSSPLAWLWRAGV